MKPIIILLFPFFIFHFSSLRAQDTIYVPQDYTFIQQAINAAIKGDIVLVDPGTYAENINFDGKAITVASRFILSGDTNYINTTIIDGSQPADPDTGSVVTFVSGEDTTSIITGFTITGGTGLYLPTMYTRTGGGIVCYNAGAKITNNKIIDNSVTNPSNAGGGGIAFMPGTSDNWIVIRNNMIKNNSAIAENDNSYGGGIYVGGDARIESNVIANNHCFVEASTGDIHGGGGICAESLSNNPLDTMILYGNIIEGNVIQGGDEAWGGGMSCGDIFACPVSIIRNNKFLDNSIVDAERGWGTGMFLDEVRGEVVIENNEFKGNSANTAAACGTVIYINEPAAEMTFKNNLISGNWAISGIGYAWAAGVWLWGAEDNLIIIDGNIIEKNEGNRAGGFYARNSNNFVFVNNILDSNIVTNSGGAIQMFQYYGSDKGQTLLPASQSGIKETRNHIGRSMHPVIANNTIVNNDGGQFGGAIFIGSYDSLCPLIYNNIFWENQAAAGNGEEIYYGGANKLLIENNLLNTNLIFGNWEGHGNIHEDPLFEGSDMAYYQLTADSPCIDAGTPDTSGLNLPPWDIIGSYRVWDGDGDMDIIIDMGAYEYGSTPVMPGIDQFLIFNSQFLIDVYPNPTNGVSSFRFQVSGYVSLKIYDLHGREVATLLDKALPAGEHAIQCDLTGLPAGLYVVELRAKGEEHRAVSKLVVH